MSGTERTEYVSEGRATINDFALPDGQFGFEEAKRLLEASQMDITKLHERIQELEADLEASASENSKLKSKYNAKFQEVEATRQNVCELEVQLQAYSTDIESLRRENRFLAKEKTELASKLEKEVKTAERLRGEWAARESSLVEQLKLQRQENRALKCQSSMFEKQLETAKNSDSALESIEVEDLKSEVKRQEKKIHQMSLEVTEAKKVAEELESRLRSELDVSASLREERDELRNLNTSLMEEAEQLQLLYSDGGASGGYPASHPDADETWGERSDSLGTTRRRNSEDASSSSGSGGGTGSRRSGKRGAQAPSRMGSLADELTSCGSGRSSPSDVDGEGRAPSIDTALTAFNPLTGVSYDIEIAQLKHKINGYEDLIEKLLQRIESDEAEEEELAKQGASKATSRAAWSRAYAREMLRGNNEGGKPSGRLAWLFGSGKPASPSVKIDGATDEPVATESTATAPTAGLPKSPSYKFDLADSKRLSTRLEKVVSRSASMVFSEQPQLEPVRGSPAAPPRAHRDGPRGAVPQHERHQHTTSPHTAAVSTLTTSSNASNSPAPSVTSHIASSPHHHATNSTNPGLMKRLWRTSVNWMGSPNSQPTGQLAEPIVMTPCEEEYEAWRPAKPAERVSSLVASAARSS
ncbi:hypothetical protein HDU96_002874 [Phlyctochytrium bullatum]|nr:hypothetical protein HDU96_002874 [Phlyctochytrium bullatum]